MQAINPETTIPPSRKAHKLANRRPTAPEPAATPRATPPAAPAQTRRFEDRREALLDGAARLFNEHGVRGGLLSDLAAQMGLATNSLTYYYRRKEDLAAACLLRSMEVMGSAADAAARAPTLQARVQGFLDRYLGLLADIAEGRHPQLIVFWDVLTLDAPHHEVVAAAYNQMFRRVRALLDAPDAPVLSPAARNARAHLLLSTANWTRAWLARYEGADYPRVARRIGALLLHGVCVPGHALADASGAPPLAAAADSDDTRSAYLRAATRLVNLQGYRGASVDRIAAELQLTKGSFYHHHETKEELIAACFERTFAVVRAAQSAALDAPGLGADRLAQVCRSLLAFQLAAPGPLLRITAWTGLPDAIRGATQQTMWRLGERFATLVLDGMADGSLRIVDPSVAAQVINGMINATAEIERWVKGVQADNAFDLFARPLFTGLLTSPGPTPPPAKLRRATAPP